jgi:hypothetical protein
MARIFERHCDEDDDSAPYSLKMRTTAWCRAPAGEFFAAAFSAACVRLPEFA